MTKSCWCSCSFEMGKTKLTLRHCPWFQTKPIVVVIVIETLQSALKRSSHYLLFQKLYFYHSNHRDHLLRSRLSRTPQGHHKSPIFARLFISRFIYWIELKHLDIPEKLKQGPVRLSVGILTSWMKKNPLMKVLKWRRPGSILKNWDLVVKNQSFKTETVWLILSSFKLINTNSSPRPTTWVSQYW